MRQNSTTVKIAHIAHQVRIQGRVSEPELEELLREYGVNQEIESYKRNLVAWRYLQYDPVEKMYRITQEGAATATVTVTMPLLNAKEVRRELVAKFAGYAPLIDIGEVI